MSAALKKKYTQHDLRRLMNEQKAKQQTTKDTEKIKITSPLAKYNDQGQLTCVLCKSVVRSESVWTVHINAKQHKQNVQLAKQLKERADLAAKAAPVAFKRPASSKPENSIPQKIIKSILRKYDVDVPTKAANGMSDMSKLTISEKIQASTSTQQSNASTSKPEETDEKLPEGFFDDPHLDAKARNIEYKDPNEEEWEKFCKEIKNVTDISTNMINEEQENATTERQIIEIDEQIRNWSRVLSLEKRKEKIIRETKVKSEVMEVDSNSSDDEEDTPQFDEFLDWRAKKSHK